MAGVCPRDGTALRVGGGSLGEDVCSMCHGRLLDAAATQRVFVDILGIAHGVLVDLARDGPQRIACPGCRSRMTEARARGVLVDLCPGCGASWLDGGELTRLARDIDEVQVAPRAQHAPGGAAPSGALELDLSTRVARAPLKFEVRCVHCDRALDLSKTNWLINTRPWCPSCASPYTGPLSALGVGWLGAIVGFLFSSFVSNRAWGGLGGQLDLGGGRLEKTPDVLKIVPADADKYFGAFYVVVR